MLRTYVYRIILASAVICLIGAASIHGETPKFGEISDEEWAMGAPDQYPDAKAVVIFDEGLHVLGKRAFYRHVRIKIISKEGSEYVAEIEVDLFRGDKIKNLKAHTITPDGKKHEVKEFFNKTVDQEDVLAFTFPTIQDGYILEYKYKIERKYYGIKPWYFQSETFTKRSSYTVEMHDYENHTPIFINIPVHIRKAVEEELKTDDGTVIDFSMELTDLLPAKPEPLMGARMDNMMAVIFRYTGYVTGWNDIGEWIDEYIESEVHTSQKDFKKAADSICAGIEDTEQKIKKLYDFVACEIVTDDDLEQVDKPSDILKAKKGRTYEKNILLVELLKSQDLPAKPLYIGTRKEYGKINVDIRNLSQFNRVLCYLEHDTANYVLDPGARCAIYPYPEANDLADQALLIDGEESRLFDIPHRPRINGTDLMSTIHVDAEGAAVCSTTIVIKGYSMEKWREKQLDSLSAEKLAEDLLEDVEVEFEILNAVLNEDLEKDRYLFDLVLKLPEFASIMDGNFFLTPCLMPVEDNPFAGDIRNFPVDFNFTFRSKHHIQVYLPENMVVADVPRNMYQTMQGGKFTRKVLTDGNAVDIKSELDIKRASFPTKVYKDVKELFDIISQSSLDQVLATAVEENAGDL